jgi:hypothetical protein
MIVPPVEDLMGFGSCGCVVVVIEILLLEKRNQKEN